jgi:YfiH family protein
LSGTFANASGATGCWAMFNRHGGVSDGVHASLNVGLQVGDSGSAVRENRRRVLSWLGVSGLLSAHQVHGDTVFCLTDELTGEREVQGYDALVTNIRDVALIIQQADCQAVLLADPTRQVVAAIHCGWRGSVLQIITKTVTVMQENYGSRPAELLAIISPSLGPCCGEFINYKAELPEAFWRFQTSKQHFDFWQISRQQLADAGLKKQNITITGICTSCNSSYFSYRRSVRNRQETTGRCCSAICLK